VPSANATPGLPRFQARCPTSSLLLGITHPLLKVPQRSVQSEKLLYARQCKSGLQRCAYTQRGLQKARPRHKIHVIECRSSNKKSTIDTYPLALACSFIIPLPLQVDYIHPTVNGAATFQYQIWPLQDPVIESCLTDDLENVSSKPQPVTSGQYQQGSPDSRCQILGISLKLLQLSIIPILSSVRTPDRQSRLFLQIRGPLLREISINFQLLQALDLC
jgi:hypothetical protein